MHRVAAPYEPICFIFCLPWQKGLPSVLVALHWDVAVQRNMQVCEVYQGKSGIHIQKCIMRFMLLLHI